jgi:cyanocobalamin reductase (cyanide-eliminating) / alkylcobalamin dealkylase
MPTLEQVVQSVRSGAALAGFDLVQPFRVGWYNACVEGPLRLDNLGSEEHLALLVGNTRALWPVFLDTLAQDAALAASPDPLDTYTTRSMTRLASALGCAHRLRFAHDLADGRVAIQALAHVAGLAYLTETHQSVHPVYGPWLSLRAVISVAVPGPPGPRPELVHPCGGCAGGCAAAFERALATVDTPPGEANMRANWSAWVASRDSCPVGPEHRFGDGQIRYHYLQEPQQLRKEWMRRAKPV